MILLGLILATLIFSAPLVFTTCVLFFARPGRRVAS